MSDFWAWVEPDEGEVEPGLYALQTRPHHASGQGPLVTIGTLNVEATTPGQLNLGPGVGYPITDYAAANPLNGAGIGNWGYNKESIVWIYDDTDLPSGDQDTYIAVADTSARPVSEIDPQSDFVENLFYFSINGNGLHDPGLARSVPPLSTQISFLAKPEEDSPFVHLYLIGSTGAAIQEVITANSLRAGANIISYYAWSPDGRYLMARVDDRMIIKNRLTSAIVLDVVADYSFLPQFSDDGIMLFYPSGGNLVIRREAVGFAVDEIVPETGTFSCGNTTRSFAWSFPRVSPDGNYWANMQSGACGSPFDLSYRSYARFFDKDFHLIASNNVSSFASGTFAGDFTNDSRWYLGGNGNINGNSQLFAGPAPLWNTTSTGSSTTGAHQVRSFQAF